MSASAPASGVRLIRLVPGVLFVLVGLVALGFVVRLQSRLEASNRWTEAPCTILAASSAFESDAFHVHVTYRYVVDSIEHTSDQVAFSDSGDRDHARAVLARHPVGSTSTCWVNPADPSDAVLERRVDNAWVGVLLGVVFVLVGLFLVRSARARRRA
ncbi:MAG: DUF3592 domain-containing protein [Planctomycetes bacterium]|nr:DUF3592 domain-containing protein [Planctomycetota bacterium]